MLIVAACKDLPDNIAKVENSNQLVKPDRKQSILKNDTFFVSRIEQQGFL